MKWRVDWSTYDCGFEIVDAETEKEAKEIFRNMWCSGEVCIHHSFWPEIKISKGTEYNPVEARE